MPQRPQTVLAAAWKRSVSRPLPHLRLRLVSRVARVPCSARHTRQRWASGAPTNTAGQGEQGGNGAAGGGHQNQCNSVVRWEQAHPPAGASANGRKQSRESREREKGGGRGEEEAASLEEEARQVHLPAPKPPHWSHFFLRSGVRRGLHCLLSSGRGGSREERRRYQRTLGADRVRTCFDAGLEGEGERVASPRAQRGALGEGAS